MSYVGAVSKSPFRASTGARTCNRSRARWAGVKPGASQDRLPLTRGRMLDLTPGPLPGVLTTRFPNAGRSASCTGSGREGEVLHRTNLPATSHVVSGWWPSLPLTLQELKVKI